MANILVVDDDGAVRHIVRLLLQRHGHDVVAVDDSRKALQIFHEGQFDLLIVDIFMPGMDGLELMKLVHQHRPHLPVIVISGHAFPTHSICAPDFLTMALRLGAACGLAKPFKSTVLLQHVAHCLEQLPDPTPTDPAGRIGPAATLRM